MGYSVWCVYIYRKYEVLPEDNVPPVLDKVLDMFKSEAFFDLLGKLTTKEQDEGGECVSYFSILFPSIPLVFDNL